MSVRDKLTAPIQLLMSNGFVAFIQLLSAIILARILGPEQRGIYGALLVIPIFITGCSLFGVHLTSARLAALQPKASKAIYGLARKALVVPAGISLTVLFFLQWIDRPASPVLTFFLGTFIIIGGIINGVLMQVELSRDNMLPVILTRVCFVFVSFLSICVLGLLRIETAISFFTVFAVAAILTPILVVFITRVAQKNDIRDLALNPPISLKSFMKKTVPDGVATSINYGAISADKIIIAFFMPPIIFGYYAIALSMAQIQNLFSEAMAPLFFARVAAQGDEIDRVWIKTRVRQGLVVNLFATILILIATPILIPLLYGQDFRPAIKIALLLAPAFAFNAARRPLDEILKGNNHSLLQSFSLLVVLGVTLLLGIPAAQTGDVLIVACAIFLSSLAGLICALFSVRNITGIRIYYLTVPRASDIQALRMRGLRMLRSGK